MAIVIKQETIMTLLQEIDVVKEMEEGFIKYSNGLAVIPPVGELLFDESNGETHIKYGYIKGAPYYGIKIASGFYNNPSLGLSSSQGMNLLFNQQTGEPEAVLLDGGFLTNVRTAAAGALVAQYFAPKNITAIGIIGTGIQAKLQLEYLKTQTSCRTVWVWGRRSEAVDQFIAAMAHEFQIKYATSPAVLAKQCNVIVTTTPSAIPLLEAEDILPGTHITAVGSDTPHKRELSGGLLAKADLIIADSIVQSKSRGEVYSATQEGAITFDKVIELGTAIQEAKYHRENEQQITIADLTGVAVQDIMIAQAVYKKYKQNY